MCAILTRSRARAGVSVRLFFACTLRVRGVTSLRFGRYASGACVCVNFMHPPGAYVIVLRVHVSAPAGCVISFAPRLILTLRAWPSACSKNNPSKLWPHVRTCECGGVRVQTCMGQHVKDVWLPHVAHVQQIIWLHMLLALIAYCKLIAACSSALTKH